MAMRVSEFLEQIKQLPDLKTLYVKGGWGAPLNASNKKRVINAYAYNADRAAKINAATADTFAMDCCGIVKSVLWGFSADPSKADGGAQYKANGVPDLSEAGFLRVCTKVSNDWSQIIPGACLFMPGHMGVYIGDGKAVECTPIWKDGCQITRVDNITSKGRANGRTWNKWGLIPYLDYGEEDMTRTETEELIKAMVPGIVASEIKNIEAARAKEPASAWTHPEDGPDIIEEVKKTGLMVGDADGNFRPKSYVTRQELAAVVFAIYKKIEETTKTIVDAVKKALT